MNADLSVVQGLNAWREILEQEYYRIEENQRKKLKPVEYPYKQAIQPPADEADCHRVTRLEVAQHVKRVVRDFAVSCVGHSIQLQKEMLVKLFSSKDRRGRGSIEWKDFLHVINFEMGIILSLSESTLLKRHLNVRERDKLSYLKFVDAMYAVKQKSTSKKIQPPVPTDKFQKARARQYEQANLVGRAQDERVKRFLTLITQRAAVYGLQKCIDLVQAIERVFYSICTDERLNCAELFMCFEACLDVRIDEIEHLVIFKRLVLENEQDSSDSISFPEFMQCFYRYEVLKKPEDPMPMSGSGSTFELLQQSRKLSCK